jgi:hypothetical protein
MRLGYTLRMLNDPSSDDEMTTAVALIDDDAPSEEQVAVLEDWASILAVSRRCEAAEETAERVMWLRQSLGMPPSARALHARAIARCIQADRRGLDDFRAALSVAETAGLGGEVCALYSNLAVEELLFTGAAEALATTLAGLESAERRHDATAAAYLRVGQVFYMSMHGECARALALADGVGADLRARAQERDLADLAAITALIRMVCGRTSPAESSAAWVGDARGDQLQTLPILAAVQADAGRADDARATLRELERTSSDARSDSIYVSMLPFSLRAAVAAGDLALGDALVHGVSAHRPFDAAVTLAWTAVTAEAGADPQAAAEGFARASQAWRSLRMHYEQAHALWGRGRCLGALGDKQAARNTLGDARRLFEQCDAAPALAAVARSLSDLTPARD